MQIAASQFRGMKIQPSACIVQRAPQVPSIDWYRRNSKKIYAAVLKPAVYYLGVLTFLSTPYIFYVRYGTCRVSNKIAQ
jgi:hypothetical protein